jgi:SWI/SNF chromatin-remodeling complex subunit SWI1
VVNQLGLPEEIPTDPPGTGTTPTMQIIKQYYQVMLYQFEQHYKSNLQSQQKQAQLAASQQGTVQGGQPSTPTRPGFPGNASSSQQGRTPNNGTAMNGMSQISSGQQQSSVSVTSMHPTQPNELGQGRAEIPVNDQDIPGMKRKIEEEELDGKRVRQKTGTICV